MLQTKTRTAAAQLSDLCGSLDWSRLPADVRERTKELVLDLLGVTLRGTLAPSSTAAFVIARRLGGGRRASLIGTPDRAAAPWAALANGTAAHALELDDVTSGSSLHPGVVVIPAALAVAQERDVSPPRLLEAIVAGYEVTMRVGDALNAPSAYARGFHPTGVAGVFGAAMAAGRVIGLESDRLVAALGIAGSMASGSLAYLSDGSWTKRLNPGWAAHAGIVAAYLAEERFTGPADVFEGPHGLLRGYTDEPRSDRLTSGLDGPRAILDVSIKPYACCRYNHGFIDAMLALRAKGLRAADVERIRLGVLSAGALLVSEPIEKKRAPDNVVDAQFSAPFAAAVALVRGAAGLDQYTDETLRDPAIRSLLALTDCYRDDELDARYPAHWPAAVEVRTRDGRTLSVRVDDPTGEPANPLTREQLRTKFTALAVAVLEPRQAEELARLCLALDEQPRLDGLGTLLRGGA